MALQVTKGNGGRLHFSPRPADGARQGAGRVRPGWGAEAAGCRVQYWRGKSGRRYLHRVYSLLDCPALPEVNYILVQRSPKNGCLTLAVGQTVEPCGSANLAAVRHQAALRGANEIHIHQPAAGSGGRDFIEQDLRAAQFEALIAQLQTQVANGS